MYIAFTRQVLHIYCNAVEAVKHWHAFKFYCIYWMEFAVDDLAYDVLLGLDIVDQESLVHRKGDILVVTSQATKE